MAASPFARLEKRLSTSIDRINAERVRVEPQLQGQIVRGPDPSRAPYEFSAVVDLKPVLANARSSVRAVAAEPGIDTDKIHVSVADAQLPADRATWPRVNDHIRLLDQDGEPLTRIAKVDKDGMGRTVFMLSWINT